MAGTNTTKNGYLGDIPTNPLDNFDNVTYNIKLYMIPPVEDQTEVRSDDTEGEPRTTTGGEVTSKGGFLNGAYSAKPENTVVLAQTGVTGTLIDDVEIMSVPSGTGGKITKTIDCTIKQPGAANFFDMIVLGRRRLGIPADSARGVDGAPFFFEINFQGYEDDINDHDNGGQIKAIAGPYRFKVLLKTATFELNSTGTSYDLTFAVADEIAYTDANYKIPTTMTTIGETIDEHIDSLVTQWNHYIQRTSAESKDTVDEIVFKKENITGSGQTIIKDQTLQRESDSTSIANSDIDNSGTSRSDAQQTEEGTDYSGETPETNKIKIEVTRGEPVDVYIGKLLARNKDYTSSITRSQIDQSGKFKYDATKTYINDFKINAIVQQLEYDNKRGGYNKRIQFEPGVFTSASGKQIATVEELAPEEQEIRRRINSMEITRAYEYILTGRNDQILNVDIKYDFGINFLIPPGGNAQFGNALLNNIGNFNIDPTKLGDPLGARGLAELAGKLNDVKKFLKLFKAAKDGSIRDLARAAGYDDAKIKEVLADKAGATATDLINRLSTRQINEAVIKKLTPKGARSQSGTETESDRQRLINDSLDEEYTPTASGYVYGGDLLQTNSYQYLDPGDIDSAEVRDAKNKEDSENNGTGTLKPGVDEAIVSDSSASGGPLTTQQNLFGYMYGQKNTADMLLVLDMVVRGDPWYLGQPDRSGGINYNKVPAIKDEISNADGINTYGGDNFILFELRQPMYFDPFIEDEDLNQGLYPTGKQNYFITGIYRVLEIVNSFSGGRFTVNLRTSKELTLDLSKIKNKDDLSLDDIRSEFEATIRVKAAMEAQGHNSEDDKIRFNDPDYTKSVLDFGSGLTIEELISTGLITSEQSQIYKDKYGG